MTINTSWQRLPALSLWVAAGALNEKQKMLMIARRIFLAAVAAASISRFARAMDALPDARFVGFAETVTTSKSSRANWRSPSLQMSRSEPMLRA